MWQTTVHTLHTLYKIGITSCFPNIAEEVIVTVQRPGAVFSPFILYRPFSQVWFLQGLVFSLQLQRRNHLDFPINANYHDSEANTGTKESKFSADMEIWSYVVISWSSGLGSREGQTWKNRKWLYTVVFHFSNIYKSQNISLVCVNPMNIN